MARKESIETLSIMHPICCGLDVHKKSISVCLLIENDAGKVEEEVRQFPTFTDELYNLKSWLLENNCLVVAIESTGVYWQSVHNVLEDSIKVILVNARHVKNLPGRKTDISDAKWLAGLLRHGLLRGSFIPAKHVRQWRQLWTLRAKLVEGVSDQKRRTHKHLQSCNIKIDSVASTLFSVTGQNLMELLLTDSETISIDQVRACAKGRLGDKVDELFMAVKGFMGDHERYILATLLDVYETLQDKVNEVTQRMISMLSDYQDTLERLDKIPGVSQVGACGILAIVGPDLSDFPNASHFCSWAGMCPGNNKSAGKRKSSRSPVRKHPLRTLLVELAWAAIKKKDTYYQNKFFRLKSRIGPKPAIYAIAHRMAKAIYYIISRNDEFRELGDRYLDRRNEAAKLKRLQTQAHRLGHKLVSLEEAA